MPYKDPNSSKAKEAKRRAYQKWKNTEHGRQVLRKNCLDYYYRHREAKIKYMRQRSKIRIREQKLLVLTHYSNNLPKCACCGESHVEFLSIDHINGGGNKHRKSLHLTGMGHNFYRWLIKKEFPEGYRVLCMNCNFSLGHYGYCPHNPKEKILESMGIRLPHNSFRKRSA
jgi:hypothetical protein